MSGGSYVPTYRHQRENPYTERVHTIRVRQKSPQKVQEDIAPTLPEIAVKAGYTVISNNAPTVMELAGNGNWFPVAMACRKFVKRGIPGHFCDHITVVVRNADGTRELRDVGINQVRYGKLPSVGCAPVRRGKQGWWGVRRMYRRFSSQLTAHGVKIYLGTFPTVEAAARARDKYVIDHDLHVPLNYLPEAVTA